MNERIKQLAEKAGAVYSNDHAVSLLDNEIEKFAELIVEECKDLLFESSENNRLPIAVDDMVHIIDTHFGVEE